MTFKANGNMKCPFRQNKEKFDLMKLLSFLLAILSDFSKERVNLKGVNFHAFVVNTQLPTVCRLP